MNRIYITFTDKNISLVIDESIVKRDRGWGGFSFRNEFLILLQSKYPEFSPSFNNKNKEITLNKIENNIIDITKEIFVITKEYFNHYKIELKL